MKINETNYGFKLIRSRKVEEQNGILYEFLHEKTGAKLAWLERAEENKAFAVSFKTIPYDDTGVFHILEHSVLNGSEKYPVKEPFVELLKSSLQTYLNALTFADKTVYPVSSRNEKDFENLVRIYLDAVFHPLIYKNREVFDQEGWHFEIDETGEVYKNGVVLNEMKGAFSEVDSLISAELHSMLYPDTCYKYVSGGHPEHIGELSYEQFIAAHKKFYHPSNAKIFLDGDLPIDTLLKIINDEYLCDYDYQECNIELTKQLPISETFKTELYPVAPGSPAENMSILSKAYIIGDFLDKNKRFAFQLLTAYLTGDNDAPLTKAILERNLAQTIDSFVNAECLQPSMFMIFRNIDASDKEELLAVVESTLKEIVENGLDKEKMLSIIDNAQFRSREGSAGWASTAVAAALSVMDVWNYDGDPIDALQNNETYEFLRKAVENGYFETLISDVLLNSPNMATLLLCPDEELSQKQAEEEYRKANDEYAAMSDEEKEIVIQRLENMCIKQNQPDTPEQLATIPQLALSDISEKPTPIPTELVDNTIYHEIPTRGIQYINLYFPIGDLTKQQLPAASFVLSILGSLATENYSADELNRLLMSNLGKFTVSISPYQDQHSPEKTTVYANVSISCLEEKVRKAIELVSEILLHSKFDDSKRIKDTLIMGIEDYRQQFIGGGHQLAMQCANAALTASGVVGDAVNGLGFFKYLEEMQSSFDEKSEQISADFEQMCREIFTNNGLMISITGKKVPETADLLHSMFPDGKNKDPQREFAPNSIESQGVQIPAPVAYAVAGNHFSRIHEKTTGAQKVLAQLLTLDYFWQEVRVKGGAYGTGIKVSDSGSFVFYTFRDPSPAQSLETFKNTIQYIKAVMAEDPDLTSIIVGTIGSSDPLLTPEQMSKLADDRYFLGNTYDDQCVMRAEILNTKASDIVALCDALDKIISTAKICVVGGEELLESCDLKEIKLL